MVTEQQVDAALPKRGFLREYVEYAKHVTDCNTVVHLASGLTLLTQVAPSNLHFPFGSPMYTNLFALVVGPSGDRKTQGTGVARRLLYHSIPDAVAEEPGSREALIEGLRIRSHQVIFYPEFGKFLAEAEKGYLQPIKATLNLVWDCQPLGRALVGKRGTPVQNPRLSLIGASAPGFLERHTEQVDWTEGFMARFLTFNAKRERLINIPKDNPAVRDHLSDQLKKMFEDGIGLAPCCGFTPDAEKLFCDWQESTIKRAQALRRATASAITRTPSLALKVATLLAWDFGDARSGNTWAVGLEELEAAIAICELHVDSVLSIGDTLANTPYQRDRRLVLSLIRNDPTSVGELLRTAKLPRRTMREIIESLLEEGSIERSNVSAFGEHFQIKGTAQAASAPAGGARVINLFGPAEPAQSSTTASKSPLSLFDEPAPSAGSGATAPEPEPSSGVSSTDPDEDDDGCGGGPL